MYYKYGSFTGNTAPKIAKDEYAIKALKSALWIVDVRLELRQLRVKSKFIKNKNKTSM